MRAFYLVVINLAVISGLSNALHVDYTGYQVFRCTPRTEQQLADLNDLYESTPKYNAKLDFWTPPIAVGKASDIMVEPEDIENLQQWFESRYIFCRRLITDVGQLVRESTVQQLRHNNASSFLHREALDAVNFFQDFQRYSAIESKLKSLAGLDPRITLETIGKSYEGRSLYLVKVSNDPASKKPVILIDAGHHAREWISHSTLMYLLESLINIDIPKMSVKECVSDLCRSVVNKRIKLDLARFDYWFVPVINPDGYEYSHTVDRLWRKTRSRSGTLFFGDVCFGTDPNRNYDVHWNEAGASSNPCSVIYAGPRAFSEPETRALASLILTPYGHARVYPEDYNDMTKVALAGLETMPMLRNTKYEYGPSAITLYPAAGGSDDYAYAKANIKYAYTCELPDKGNRGFVLPATEIIPVGHEVLISLRAMTDTLAKIENL